MIIGFLLLAVFAVAQGGVVFVTAWLCARILNVSSAWWKLGLMLASLGFWTVFTIGGYSALGGEGGLMDGFGLVLMSCFSATISALVYTVVWASRPAKEQFA